jgi:hypothetical protein
MRSWLTHAQHWRRCSGSTQHSASASCDCDLLVLAQLLDRLQEDLVSIQMRGALLHLHHLHVNLKTLGPVPMLGIGMSTKAFRCCLRRATQGPLRSGLAGGDRDVVSPPSAAAAHGGRHMADQEHQLAAQLGALKAAHEHEQAQAAARMRFAARVSSQMPCRTVMPDQWPAVAHGCQQAATVTCQQVDLLSQAC